MFNSFLEQKRYSKVHIENDQEVRNPSIAPFICDGGSVFKKPSYFLNSLVLGPNKGEKEGMLSFVNGEFKGYNGEKWVSFAHNSLWKESEGILYTDGQRVGINKINPRKMLEVGGDVAIDKKLVVRDEVTLEGGLQLVENIAKKRKGMLRFWDGFFEGYDGEKWVRFGDFTQPVEVKQEVNLETIQKIKLLNCPLTFSSGNQETHVYYDFENSIFKFEKMHNNFEKIASENISAHNLHLSGDIIFEEGGHKTIKNISDPINENEVATKRYVDAMCSGLQDYVVCDYFILADDVELGENAFRKINDFGDLKEKDLVFILTDDATLLVEIQEIGELIKTSLISNVSIPAKVVVRSGKYANSEMVIFTNNNYLQLNGKESVEYREPLYRIGGELRLKYDKNIFNDNLSFLDKSIQWNHLGDSVIKNNNIGIEEIEGKHLKDNTIDARHLAPKSINNSHIQPKSIGEAQLKDGFLKNNHFTPGIISEKELANECIGVTNLKHNIILDCHLTKSCITSENIKDNAIQLNHLQEKIIDAKHLREKIILSDHLNTNIIKMEHLNEKIIENKHFNNQVISSDNLMPNVIKKEHLSTNSVNGLHIQENSITSGHIKEQVINGKHIQMHTLLDWHIGDSMIKSRHLDIQSIDGTKLCDKLLEERHLMDGIITGNHLKKNTVNGNHISLGVIEDKHLANYAVRTNKVMDGAITETKLAENSITTSKIKDHSISNEKLKLSFLKISSDPVFTVTQMVNLGETLSLGLNPNYMIPKRRDGVVEFMSATRFGEEGSGQVLEVNMEMKVKSDADFNNITLKGINIHQIGEIKGIWNKLLPPDNFLNSWAKCDGKRCSRNDYPQLAEYMGEDEFHLPDIKNENMEYYIKVKS